MPIYARTRIPRQCGSRYRGGAMRCSQVSYRRGAAVPLAIGMRVEYVNSGRSQMCAIDLIDAHNFD